MDLSAKQCCIVGGGLIIVVSIEMAIAAFSSYVAGVLGGIGLVLVVAGTSNDPLREWPGKGKFVVLGLLAAATVLIPLATMIH